MDVPVMLPVKFTVGCHALRDAVHSLKTHEDQSFLIQALNDVAPYSIKPFTEGSSMALHHMCITYTFTVREASAK